LRKAQSLPALEQLNEAWQNHNQTRFLFKRFAKVRQVRQMYHIFVLKFLQSIAELLGIAVELTFGRRC
jgi:hypothetical protein